MKRREFLETVAAVTALPAFAAAQRPGKPAGARYIWWDAEGEGRNLFASFRKTFTVAGPVDSAVLHVFADTVYQLFVNGEFVEFGPVRVDPRFPLYDSHDLAQYLRPGRNVIAIEVNCFGIKTFKAMPVRGGLVAWGEVRHAGGIADLTTGATPWRCIRPKARARYASRLSFALPPGDLIEQNSTEDGWKTLEFDDSPWPLAVEIEKQNSWGELQPRNIPFMSGRPVEIEMPAPVFPLERREEWHSFWMPTTYFDEYQPGYSTPFSNFIAFSSWLYSPRQQTITVGVHTGRHWLNGVEVPQGVASINRSMRLTQQWPLRQGWNYLFGASAAYHDRFDEYFALPADGGFFFSTEKDAHSPYAFRHTHILKHADYEAHLKPLPLPYAPEENLESAGGWVYARRGDVAQNPCRETSWDCYGDPWEVLPPAALDGHVFRLSDYPHGFALQLDLQWMHLMLPRLRLRGVRGSTLDVVYTERLSPDREHLQQYSYFPVSDRVLCTLDAMDWMPANPRGARYCLVTVRHPQADVTLESVRLRSANYPAAHQGYFRCSDACLTEIWQMCARTQQANMEDAYIDCAGRERGMYGRDTVIQFHVNLATFGDHKLMNRCLELFGQSADAEGRFRIVYPTYANYTHNDFALNMVEGYGAYYDYTGDDARIRHDWPAIRTNLAYFHKLSDQRADGLLEYERRPGSGVPHPAQGASEVSCLHNLTYLLAVQSALRLARAIGQDGDARDLERRATRLAQSAHDAFWDADPGCYRDTLAGTAHSADSSLFAVRAGIVAPGQLAAVRDYLTRELHSVFVNGYNATGGFRFDSSFAFYILDGLYKAGMADLAEKMMRQGWGYFLISGCRTTPESFTMDGSLCHAWSASPAFYLSKYVLGIEFPTLPDLDTVRINIQAHGITEAEGAWPHPRGAIQVKWHTEGERRVIDYVHAPAGVKVLSL